MKQQSIGEGRAIHLYESKWWLDRTAREICDVQLFTVELCMPFALFHEAIEACIGRPVYTHEFGLNVKGIIDEYEATA